jgi:hypothetical protein
VVVEVVHHGIDDIPRGLGSPGAVEIRHRAAAVPTLQRGKVGSDRIDVETLPARDRRGSLHGKAPRVRKKVMCESVQP